MKRQATLIEVLHSAFPEASRTHLKKMIRYGCIRVPECVTMPGGIVRQAEYLVKAGWHVEVKKYQEREAKRDRPPFKILFEDDSILAVYKPAGILSSGRTTEKIRSMFGMVNSYLQKSTRGMQRAYTVHRLDREVSGILLFVAPLVLLIHNDQAEVLERKKERGTYAEDDERISIVQEAVPYLDALVVGEFGMVDKQAIAKDACQAFGYLRCHCNLGQEIKHLPSCAEHLVYQVDVELGFPGGGRSVEEAGLVLAESVEDFFVGHLLRVGKGMQRFQAADMPLQAAYLFFVIFENPPLHEVV